MAMVIHYSPYVHFDDLRCECGSHAFIGVNGTSRKPPPKTPEAKYVCFKCGKRTTYGELTKDQLPGTIDVRS